MLATTNIPVVALVSQKGGVGRTTTTLGIASAAAHAGKKVLVIDADPQGNTTSALEVNWAKDVATNDVMEADIPGCAADAATSTSWGTNVFAIPADADLASCEIDVTPGAGYRLATAMEGAPEKLGVDLVLIDCAPGVGGTVTNALIAATHVLVVTEPSAPGITAVEKAIAFIKLIRQHCNPELVTSGVLVNGYQNTREMSGRLEELSESLGDGMWEPIIPHRAVIAEAFGAHQPIHTFVGGKPAHDAAEMYSTHFERLMGVTRPKLVSLPSKKAVSR